MGFRTARSINDKTDAKPSEKEEEKLVIEVAPPKTEKELAASTKAFKKLMANDKPSKPTKTRKKKKTPTTRKRKKKAE